VCHSVEFYLIVCDKKIASAMGIDCFYCHLSVKKFYSLFVTTMFGNCTEVVRCFVCSSKLFKLCFVVHYFYNISCISDGKKCRLLHSEETASAALYFCVRS